MRIYWFFIWTNLNPLHPRMLCANFGWNWLSGSGEEDFFNFVNVFSLFRYYLPLEKGGALHLNKLESPLPKDVLCQVWLKLAQWFWRRRLFISSMYFHYLCNYLPLEKAGPFIWTNLNPLHPRMLCAKFGWNWPSGSGEEDENVKSLRQLRRQKRRRTTDKFWTEKLTWAFGSGELKRVPSTP